MSVLKGSPTAEKFPHCGGRCRRVKDVAFWGARFDGVRFWAQLTGLLLKDFLNYDNKESLF